MSQRGKSLEWTVRRLLDWSLTYLQDKGIDSPKVTAEWLLADALSCSRMDLFFRYDQPLLPEELAAYKARLKRRSQREPLQYILGEWEFWSLPFYVDSRVLIPRPETEVLIEQVVNAEKDGFVPAQPRILDLCTGSGAIACTLAKELPESTVLATDVSRDALMVAYENVKRLELVDRVTLKHTDMFKNVPSDPPFDILVSNPPYVTQAEMEELEPEVRDYEPAMALVGGQDGLDFVREILRQVPTYLAPRGLLAVEFGASQGEAIRQLAEAVPELSEVSIVQDYARRDRILFARRA
ncbi:MAG: peptide chain release factor N(5)-glutamine methyltransferase [Deltaproteobacteria bacterium]|nr:MAG: peptide chain release factor N(5)-glutamine methyltransferase [Deltaproteobacteria bacterium]